MLLKTSILWLFLKNISPYWLKIRAMWSWGLTKIWLRGEGSTGRVCYQWGTWYVTHDMCHMICDMWNIRLGWTFSQDFSFLAFLLFHSNNLIYDTWHGHRTWDIWNMTPVMLHVVHGVGWTFSQNFSSISLMVWDYRCLKGLVEKDHSIIQSVNE